MFDYDWFHGPHFEQQKREAMLRCASRRFDDLPRDEVAKKPEFNAFLETLHLRTLVYLRDGFSYELKGLADVSSKSHLTFECEPVDDQYKVGAFVISVPFEEIARIEVFAVAPDEMPPDSPAITGFRIGGEPPPAGKPQP